MGAFLSALLVRLSTLDPILSEIRVSGEGGRGLGTEGRFLNE